MSPKLVRDLAVGISYPWRSYGSDFGANAWGHMGLSRPDHLQEIARDFQAIATAFSGFDTRIVRFFLFADGRTSPLFDPSGNVIGLDPRFFYDLDALFAVAEDTGLLLLPVLLDFHWCKYAAIVNDVRLAGHSDVIREARKREGFLDRALAPLLERYGGRGSLYAWEIMNEPEWVTRGMTGFWRGKGDRVQNEQIRDFVAACAERIHGLADDRVTLGSAGPGFLRFWRNIGLDLYQVHCYPGWRNRFPWPAAADLDMNAPVLIGEVPTRKTAISPEEYLEAAQAGGYEGVLFWSYRAADRYSDRAALKSLRNA